MLSAENLDVIRSEGERILVRAREDPARPIPQYPGWVMSDLVSHLGSIHGRTTLICRERPAERVPGPTLPEGVDVLDWYEANLEAMLTTLEEVDPDITVWGLWPNPSLGLWERRMVIETGIHRWDADRAFGDPGPLSELVALSGLNEFADMWLPRMGEMPVLEIRADDFGRSWVYGSGASVTKVSVTASDIFLRLMSRPSPVVLPDEWAGAVDALEPPRK